MVAGRRAKIFLPPSNPSLLFELNQAMSKLFSDRTSQLPDDQRIVMTAVGLTSPNGNNLEDYRAALLAGRSVLPGDGAGLRTVMTVVTVLETQSTNDAIVT